MGQANPFVECLQRYERDTIFDLGAGLSGLQKALQDIYVGGLAP